MEHIKEPCFTFHHKLRISWRPCQQICSFSSDPDLNEIEINRNSYSYHSNLKKTQRSMSHIPNPTSPKFPTYEDHTALRLTLASQISDISYA